MTLITFTNKSEYLTWRKQWRAEYAQLSQNIRGLRKGIKEAMRKHQYAGTAQNDVRRLRQHAVEMLELRKQSKIVAQQQYLASKKTQHFTAATTGVS